MADVISTTVRSFRERSGVFEIEKDGRVKTGGVGGLDIVIAAAGRGLMGFEDSGVTPRNLTLRLLRTTKLPHRLRDAKSISSVAAPTGEFKSADRLRNRRKGSRSQLSTVNHDSHRIVFKGPRDTFAKILSQDRPWEGVMEIALLEECPASGGLFSLI